MHVVEIGPGQTPVPAFCRTHHQTPPLRFSPQITVNSPLTRPHDHLLPLPPAVVFRPSLSLLRTFTFTSNSAPQSWSTLADIIAYASDIKRQRWSVLLPSSSVLGTDVMVARA